STASITISIRPVPSVAARAGISPALRASAPVPTAMNAGCLAVFAAGRGEPMLAPNTDTDHAPEMAQTRFAKDQLKAIVERIERLEEEKKTISDDIRDVYAEAKGNGYDVKALRAIVRMRKQDTEKRREQEAVLETYMHALGMLSDTPLGEAALRRVKIDGMTQGDLSERADLS